MIPKNREWTQEEIAIILRYRDAAQEVGNRSTPTKEVQDALEAAGYLRTASAIRNKLMHARRNRDKRLNFEIALGREIVPSHPSALFPRYTVCGVPSRLDQHSETAQRGHAAKMKILRDLPGEAHELRMERTPGKGLVFSDTHGHLMRVDAVRAAVLSNLDAEFVAIVGDIFDFYSLSYFTNEVRVPLIAEWDLVGQLVLSLSQIFPRVILVRGNHDARPQRTVIELLKTPETAPFIRGLLDPLILLAEGIGYTPEGEPAKVYNFTGSIEYSDTGIADSAGACIRVGNTLLSHADRYLGSGLIDSPLRTVAVVSNDLAMKKSEPHDCCIQAHTHALGQTAITRERLIIECGCMSDKADYQINKKIKYKRQLLGWVELYQHADGTIDMERTWTRYYGRGRVNR